MININKNENLYLEEDWEVKNIVPSGETPSISMGITKYDFININDSRKLRFNLSKIEPSITLIDGYTVDNKEKYISWFLEEAINENFNFKSDNNVDGLADGSTIENGSVSYIKENDRNNIQNIILNEGGKYVVSIPISKFYQNRDYFWLYFDIKMVSGKIDVDVNVYYNNIYLTQSWHQHFIAGENNYDWIIRLLKFNIYRIPLFDEIKVIFTGSNSEFMLDNLLITKEKNIFRNPEVFSYNVEQNNIEIENLISEKNIYLIYKGIQNKNIRLYWGVLNRIGLIFLKKLVNKPILFKTHDRKIITGKIKNLRVNYLKRTRKPIVSIEASIEQI